jgi:hypothetical protein
MMKDISESAKHSLQQWSRIVALNVRNRMENFHCKHLSDEQMKELNPIIRNAVYEALHALLLMTDGKSEPQRIYGAMNVGYWLAMVPAYWEAPDLPADVGKRLKKLTLRELRRLPWMSTEQSRREFAKFCANDLAIFGSSGGTWRVRVE